MSWSLPTPPMIRVRKLFTSWLLATVDNFQQICSDIKKNEFPPPKTNLPLHRRVSPL